ADLGHPEGGVEVAEPALPVLQLRLEEVDRVPGARVAVGVLGELLLEEGRRVLAPDLLQHAAVELGVELLVAREVACVEKRRLDLEVAPREPLALSAVAQRVAHLDPGVPDGLEDTLGV